MNRFIYLLLLLFTTFNWSCESTSQSEDLSKARGKQLSYLYEKGIQPAHDDLVVKAKVLAASAAAFTAAPDEAKLTTLRQHWQGALFAYKRCELYNIGDVNDAFIRYKLHRWPIEVEKLERVANTSSEQINAKFIARQSDFTIGLAAIEYLLFSPARNTANAVYLRELCANLEQQSIALQKSWSDYAAAFQSGLSLNILGGQNQLINGLAAFLEESVHFRLGKPLGEKTGGTLQLDMVETPYAHISLLALRAGMKEWQRAYLGTFEGAENGYGFDDYLSSLDQEALAQRIGETYQIAEQALEELLVKYPTGNLVEALANDQEAVTDVQSKIRDLLRLVKADLASQTGATITINDTDGD